MRVRGVPHLQRSPYLSPISLMRQATSALYYAHLTGWRGLTRWMLGARRTIPMAAGAVGMGCIGFPNHPVWEVTTACNLSCGHCHASSGLPMPDELTTEEGRALLDEVVRVPEFRMMVFTGGEPLVRGDILDLIAHSQKVGLTPVIATNATLIDRPLARQLKKLGVAGIAVSVDARDPEVHDRIRGEEGSFARAMDGIEAARSHGLSIQFNITAMKDNLDQVPDVIEMADQAHADIVLVYQLVPVGRGDEIRDRALSADENRNLLDMVAHLQSGTRTVLEPVAAPQYWPHITNRRRGLTRSPGRLARACFHGCVAGTGLAYIKPDGEIWPCPFLPLSAGSVRSQPFSQIWRQSDLFRSLRQDPLKGKCGTCEQSSICRGCRGRAHALTGDYLAEDPSCFMTSGDQPPDPTARA